MARSKFDQIGLDRAFELFSVDLCKWSGWTAHVWIVALAQMQGQRFAEILFGQFDRLAAGHTAENVRRVHPIGGVRFLANNSDIAGYRNILRIQSTEKLWRKRIFVRRAHTQHSKEPETPKTAAGERYIKLLPAALEALKAQKAFTFMEGEEIFRNPRTDKRWTGDMVIRQRMWKRVLLRAGVRYRYPYQMRHTYASMMLQAGESVMWVAQQMGHTDWTFTARTYSRWVSIDAPEAGSLAAKKWG